MGNSVLLYPYNADGIQEKLNQSKIYPGLIPREFFLFKNPGFSSEVL